MTIGNLGRKYNTSEWMCPKKNVLPAPGGATTDAGTAVLQPPGGPEPADLDPC